MQRYHWSVKPPNYNRSGFTMTSLQFNQNLIIIHDNLKWVPRQALLKEHPSVGAADPITKCCITNKFNGEQKQADVNTDLMLSLENEHQNNQLQKVVPILVFHLTLALIRIKNKIGTLQIDMSCMASFLIS
jgi:hypothetical protein